jgi:hypothetical protein
MSKIIDSLLEGKDYETLTEGPGIIGMVFPEDEYFYKLFPDPESVGLTPRGRIANPDSDVEGYYEIDATSAGKALQKAEAALKSVDPGVKRFPTVRSSHGGITYFKLSNGGYVYVEGRLLLRAHDTEWAERKINSEADRKELKQRAVEALYNAGFSEDQVRQVFRSR